MVARPRRGRSAGGASARPSARSSPGPERPIVLCRRGATAPASRPRSRPRRPLVGLLLPYAPAPPPAPRRGGPPARHDEREPLRRAHRLRGRRGARAASAAIADLFLVHDRPIASRCDDSVARVVAGRPLVLRRSRGFVPRPVRIGAPLRRARCSASARSSRTPSASRAATRRVLGPHVGDLDEPRDLRGLRGRHRAARGASSRCAPRSSPATSTPHYLSTSLGAGAGRALGVPLVEVQHHHAHAAAAMAEHGLDGPGPRARLGRHRPRHRRRRLGRRAAPRRARPVRAARHVPAAPARRRRPGDPRAVARRPRRARRRLRRRGAARRAPALPRRRARRSGTSSGGWSRRG